MNLSQDAITEWLLQNKVLSIAFESMSFWFVTPQSKTMNENENWQTTDAPNELPSITCISSTFGNLSKFHVTRNHFSWETALAICQEILASRYVWRKTYAMLQ